MQWRSYNYKASKSPPAHLPSGPWPLPSVKSLGRPCTCITPGSAAHLHRVITTVTSINRTNPSPQFTRNAVQALPADKSSSKPRHTGRPYSQLQQGQAQYGRPGPQEWSTFQALWVQCKRELQLSGDAATSIAEDVQQVEGGLTNYTCQTFLRPMLCMCTNWKHVYQLEACAPCRT